jgi:hypothetical protein
VRGISPRTSCVKQPLTEMSALPQQLAEDVFLCLSGSRIVFLDLRQNQYLCLNQRNSQAAIGLFTGLNGLDENPTGEKRAADCVGSSEDTRRIIKALTDRGLIIHDGTNRKATAPVRIPSPATALFVEGSMQMPAIRIGHWTAFLYASFKASWKLRCYSIQRTVCSIRNRKQRGVVSQATDGGALGELVAIFHQLRPFYVRKYLCLYDSLALVEFLAHYRFYPQWVFGVTAEPFNAHCWVQECHYVLNDTAERVGRYTPIMVI